MAPQATSASAPTSTTAIVARDDGEVVGTRVVSRDQLHEAFGDAQRRAVWTEDCRQLSRNLIGLALSDPDETKAVWREKVGTELTRPPQMGNVDVV